MRKPSEEYLKKVKLLSKEEIERLMARMRTKLMRRLEDKEMNVSEVVAIQLEIEDEELNEWRQKMAELRKKTKAK